MRRGLLVIIGIFMACGVTGAAAQSLYNSPNAEGGGTFDFGGLFRRNEARTTAQPNTYAVTPGNNPSADNLYQQRRVALNQWREQRDAQAYSQQQRSMKEMAAASEAVAMGYYSPAATPGIPGATSQPAQTRPAAPVAPVYVGPMTFDKKDNAGIQTPRRLFNPVE